MNVLKAIAYAKGHVVDIYRSGASGSVPIVVCVGAPGFHDHAGNVALAKAICEQGSVSVLSPSYQLGWVGEAFGGSHSAEMPIGSQSWGFLVAQVLPPSGHLAMVCRVRLRLFPVTSARAGYMVHLFGL